MKGLFFFNVPFQIAHICTLSIRLSLAGNRMLRELILQYVPSYLKASTKTEKGHVIVDIVERLRRDSPTGVGLVRQNKKTGRWSYIGLEKAKDKIGHALRKASLEKTKSLSKDSRTNGKQQYQSSNSLTTLSTTPTTPSPTPMSSVSLPTSPSNHQQQTARYENRRGGHEEPYQRAYHHHYQHPAYYPHYHPGHETSSYEGGSSGYEVYYPYPTHAYPGAEYSYPPAPVESSHPPHYGTTSAPYNGEAPTAHYSPICHSPIGHDH